MGSTGRACASSYLDLGQPPEALPFLRRSLERCAPAASIVRKLYALLAQCHRRLGPPTEAPRRLLGHALLQEGQDPAAAERALRYVLTLVPNHAEAGHNLGVLLRRNGQPTDGTARGSSGPAES